MYRNGGTADEEPEVQIDHNKKLIDHRWFANHVVLNIKNVDSGEICYTFDYYDHNDDQTRTVHERVTKGIKDGQSIQNAKWKRQQGTRDTATFKYKRFPHEKAVDMILPQNIIDDVIQYTDRESIRNKKKLKKYLSMFYEI